MTTSSARRLDAPLKTYSRRANSKEEPQSCKKRPIEEVSTIEVPSLPKKIKRSSIQNYFKSLSSPATTSSSPPNSSDPLQPAFTPPSSPPRTTSPPTQSKPLRRLRRRLKTRPHLAPIAKMSDSGEEGIFSFEMDGEGIRAKATPPTSFYLASSNSSPTRSPTRPRCTTVIGFPVTSPKQIDRTTAKIEGRSRALTVDPSGLSTLLQPAACEGPVRNSSPVKGAYTGLLPANIDNNNVDIHFHLNSKFPCFAPTAPTAPAAIIDFVPTAPINIPKTKPRISSGTTQVLLDLGAERFVECKTCGLYYNQTNKKDRAEHEKFHHEFIEGKVLKKTTPQIDIFEKYVDLSPTSSLARFTSPFSRKGEVHRVRVVDRSASNEVRFYFEEALDHSYNDMDGLRVSDKELWSEIKNPQDSSDPHPVPRYKLYVYSIALEPVGFLLAERIFDASPFVDNNVLSDSKHNAFMSVDRIWVKKDRRHKGIATKLLDLARDTFIPGLVLSKKNIAFSFPTAAGIEFGRKYTGRAFADAWFLVHI